MPITEPHFWKVQPYIFINDDYIERAMVCMRIESGEDNEVSIAKVT